MDEHESLNFVKIASVGDLPENERLFFELEGQPLVIVNLAGKLFAFGDVCTHDNGPLGDGELDGFEIICPRHGARFDIRTGKATKSPAFKDIPSFPVKVENGEIFIGIEKTTS
jgi:3-phenylpropionate/trans-cinnamate dioxygenase ferredoxin component